MTASGGSEGLQDDETAVDEMGEDEPREPPSRVSLYVTPISTLVLLNVLTLGLYSLFWFYRHWSVQKRAHGLPISPLARAFFSIFFVHALFKNIDRAARASGLSPRWNPSSQATNYVAILVASRVIGRLASDELAGIFVDIVLTAATLLPLARAQQIANLANGRPVLDDEDDEDDEDA